MGRAAINTLLGPAFQQWDFSAIKMIPIRETMNLQFRAEFINIFNNVNFVLPNNDISSQNFGQIQAAQPGLSPHLLWARLFHVVPLTEANRNT